ncbi:MAG: bile acid:sodium symporter family protein [Pseudomonadota bacterium]
MASISMSFPLLAVALTVLAYFAPGLFTPFSGAVVPLLMIIMFAMGLTLNGSDFKRVAARPGLIALGIILQYTVMPLAAFAIGHAMALSPELIAGLVLLGCSPGGTASNVMSYLARADVALSVSLTMVSTLVAVLLTPALTWLLAGQTVPVDIGGMLDSMMRIVLVPVILGILINTLLGHRIEFLRSLLPYVATAAILCIIAIVVALNRDELALAGAAILVAVILHNSVGLLCGYWLPRVLGFDRTTCRTIALETGMQNSALAAALALGYFSSLAALPGAIFSVWHNLSGAILAGIWGSRSESEQGSTGKFSE